MVADMKLPDRLRTIADFIEKGSSVADIGTDHGLLPVYLARYGLADNIIASDISRGSLRAALRTATKHGVLTKITFIAAPGLSGLGEMDADTIVLAGMGGETIAGIINDAPWTRRHEIRLILQPQSKTTELYTFLRENGYIIHNAKLAYDNKKYYVILLAMGGESDSTLTPELELLTQFMNREDPLFAGYLDYLIEKTRRVIDKIKNSGTPEIQDMAIKLSTYMTLKENSSRKYEDMSDSG